MRRIFPATLIALALAAMVAPAGASESIVDRPPMDLGSNQTGTLTQVSQDLLDYSPVRPWWFDAGVSYPTGTLQDSNVDPGLLLRFNHELWKDESLAIVGSLGFYFGNDSYFNDAQEEIALNAPITTSGYSGIDIQSRYYMATPAMLSLQIAPFSDGSISPVFALGPGIVWSHESTVTSAVNNGVGSVSLLDTTNPLITGPYGEQEISPYGVRSRTAFNLGWEAKAGIGFRMSSGPEPLWMRLVATGTTYYVHTAPRTLLGFAASFSR